MNRQLIQNIIASIFRFEVLRIKKHRGVLIAFDGDMDYRIQIFIDNMHGARAKHLIAAGEHEGNLCLLWEDHKRTSIPEEYREDAHVVFDGDIWTVSVSVGVSSYLARQFPRSFQEPNDWV